MKRSGYVASVGEQQLGQTVTLQGWVARRRDFGKLIFLEVRDRTGVLQVEVEPDSAAFAEAEKVRAEFVVEIEGELRLRPESQRKEGLGQFEVVAKRLQILNEAKTPPFELEQGERVSEEIRMKYRYLDLRRPEMFEKLRLRSKVIAALTSFLDAEGFLQVETPMLTKSTPEGARDFLVPSRLSKGEFYALPQSPQLFKQLLMIAGVDRYYQFARCFRDEDLRADRQPDFTQLDMEMSFVDQEDILALNERLLRHVFQTVLGEALPSPLPRMTYADAMNDYGSDKPDVRFDMKFADVTDVFGGAEFKAFADAVANGGVVKVVAAPELTRKQIDELERVAKQNGARGLAWAKREGNSLTGGISKFVGAQASELIARTGLAEGGTLLFSAGAWRTAVEALGAVRLALRDLFDLAANGPKFAMLWVTDFPQLDRDPETGTWTYMHHPFTAPHDEDLPLFGTDRQGEIRAKAYDLVLNGFEIGGGSVRIHSPEVQATMFTAIGFSEEQARAKFGFFMDALGYGTPPHGGIAWGFDRLVMVMSGATSIREVIAFPKNNRGVDLMVEAPGSVDEGQLAEVGLALRE
ncbi:aspartate--tRNA ligase [Deinococcus yavapaiensis]|uniref:Aspartate--tRNA ligase n=1 Tax=Deinococcus yavapaiensis KR-236 TaxID=694435 RepID=A0A318S5Z2_9DEIO|nr:aspartate--tRNA ligase [Deinococcus yavapaiensis]PYE53042.1 aspartyl-tRNA synthetase [Deinococcus yavapaiensis KR-236]